VTLYFYGALALVAAAIVAEIVAHLSERLRPQLRQVRVAYLIVGLLGFAAVAIWAGRAGTPAEAVPVVGPAPPPGISDVVPSPALGGGWGPDRATYTMAHPAGGPVLNSITDNSAYGDERNFVQVRNLTKGGKFAEKADVCRGEHAEWFVLIANDASSSLGDKGTVRDLTMRALAGDKGTRTPVTVELQSSNAGRVWDSASVSCGDRAVTLRFLPGTARVISNASSAAGWFLDGDPFQGPLTAGAERPDGLFPADKLSNGKDGWVGYVVFQTAVL